MFTAKQYFISPTPYNSTRIFVTNDVAEDVRKMLKILSIWGGADHSVGDGRISFEFAPDILPAVKHVLIRSGMTETIEW